MFKITNEALTFLKQKDPYMKALITHVDTPYEPTYSDPFEALVVIITGQQISEKAAASIVERLKKTYPPLTPSTIKALSVHQLKSVGLSNAKANTILRIANLDELDHLKTYSKSNVEKTLLNVKGIGPWSVEMFHFMCLKDPDILSLGDIAVVNGIKRLYGVNDEKVKTFQNYFSPYGSTAAAYLWKLLEVDEATLKKIKEDVE